jgi:DNA-binding CsgD family transcriptional regulator
MPSLFLISRGLEKAAALLASGHLGEALSAVADREGAPAELVRSRVEFRTGDYACALAHAERAYALAQDQTERLTARSSGAIARARLGRPIESFDARDVVSVEPDALGELLLGIAAAYVAAADDTAAERWLAFLEPSDPRILAEHLLLKARIAGLRLAFIDQAHIIGQVLDLLKERRQEEAVLFCEAARIYAILARDLPLGDRIEWLATDEISLDGATRFEVLRTRAWTQALSGEFEAGLASLMRAAAEAATPLAHLAIHLDLAAIAVANGDTHSPFVRAAIETVGTSSRAIRWEDVADENILLLPQVAQVAAEAQYQELAQENLVLAIRMRPTVPAFRIRFDVLLREAHAFIHAQSDERVAISAAREAYASFDKLGYAWRAGRAALLIHQLTGLRVWELRAKEKLANYHSSRFYRLLDAGNSRRLTRRQQQVLDAARHGKSPAQIAAHLGIAEETVRKHLGPVMRHFGVKTRLELLARMHQ